VAIALGCPAVALPSILAVPSAAQGQACLAIGDARRGSYWTAQIKNLRLISGPELTDLSGLQEILESHLAAGLTVFSFEDPKRFPLPADLSDQVKLEFPSAASLWQAWCHADEKTRAASAAEIPQPIYLKPPHITPAKRAWLV
jgi:tRNA A37 threonylcarbamoyladenosine modification protein TsaB